MCLSCPDIDAEVERLAHNGVHLISDPITDTPPGGRECTIIAVRDPDGTVVEFVGPPTPVPAAKYAMPFFVHVNVNVSNYEEGWDFYQKLGFSMAADLGLIENRFYQALCIPDPGIATHAALIRLPREPSFLIDLIEWRDPHTDKPTSPPGRCLGIAAIAIGVPSLEVT
jgi:catechol 2,3-dioxygenase-like lactoylglutathione lyase family enzyme